MYAHIEIFGYFSNWASKSLQPSALDCQLMSLKQRKCTDDILPQNKQFKVYTFVSSTQIEYEIKYEPSILFGKLKKLSCILKNNNGKNTETH